MLETVINADEMSVLCARVTKQLQQENRPPWNQQSAKTIEQKLARIAQQNFQNGRWERLRNQRRHGSPQHAHINYLNDIAQQLEQYELLVNGLMENDNHAWATTRAVIKRALVHYLPRLRIGWKRAQTESEDLTQALCECLPAKLNQYTWDVDFWAWLRCVATRFAYDKIQRSTETLDVGHHYDLTTLAEFDDEAVEYLANKTRIIATVHDCHHVYENEAWKEALATLPSPLQMTVFYHRRLCGWPIVEVAGAIGRTPGATSSLLMRAEQHLRDFLREHPDHFDK